MSFKDFEKELLANPNVKIGRGVDLTEEDIDPRNIKHRITIFLDLDIIHKAQELAGGKGYQTLINQKLRESLMGEGEESSLVKVLRELVDKIDSLTEARNRKKGKRA